MQRFDIAIVGAGPAGATAARFLAASGHEVVMLEQEKGPRDKPCGGGLRPGVLLRIPHLKALAGRFVECATTEGVLSAPGAPFVSYKVPAGEHPMMFQTRRSVFDRVLVEDAVSKGATLEEGARVRNAAGGEKGWKLRLEDGREFRARGVIAAGGASCPVAKRLRVAGGAAKCFPRERLAVSWAREFEVGERFVEEAFGEARTAHIVMRFSDVTGYAWVFPKREHVNIGFGALIDDLRGIDGLEVSQGFAKHLAGRGLLPSHPDGGRWQAAPIPMGGPSGPVVRPGAVAIGDAAGFVSPLAGDGIYYAVESGRMAAEVMHRGLDKGDMTPELLVAYGKAWKKAWGKELDVLWKVAQRISRDPVSVLKLAATDPKIPSLVLRLFQGEGDLGRTAIALYGRSALASLRMPMKGDWEC